VGTPQNFPNTTKQILGIPILVLLRCLGILLVFVEGALHLGEISALNASSIGGIKWIAIV